MTDVLTLAPTMPIGLPATPGGLFVDLFIVFVVLALMIRGWRRGGLRAVIALGGAAIGALAGWFLSALTTGAWSLGGVPASLVVTVGVIVGAICGYALARHFGRKFLRSRTTSEPPLLDRGLGVAAYGAIGLVACVLLASMASSVLGGGVSAAARDSMVVRALDDDRIGYQPSMWYRIRDGFGDGLLERWLDARPAQEGEVR